MNIDWGEIAIAVWLAYKFIGFMKDQKAKRAQDEAPPAPEPEVFLPELTPEPDVLERQRAARAIGELARLRTLPLAAQAHQLAAGFGRLHRPGAREGTGDVLRDLVLRQIQPDVEQALAVVEGAVADGAMDHTRGELGRAVRRLKRVEGELAVLDRLLTWHQDKRMDALLADAEALAENLLAPWQEHARTYGLSFPQQHPVCAPADPDQESLWIGLLPDDHPVVFVPDDFDEDLYRWVSVAHEIGHLAWLRQGGLAEELAELAQPHGRGRLLILHDGQLSGSLEDLFAAWWPELVADMVTMLTLGPAGMRGMVESFARPDQPGAVLVAPAQGRTYDEHPPDHLRVHVAALWLEAMGFRTEGLHMLEAWSAEHGEPDRLIVATRGGQYVPLPLQPFLDFSRQLVDTLYAAELRSLAGHQLRAVPGLEMTPGRWAQVLEAATSLLAGRLPRRDPTVLLAGAIMARHRRPASHAAIAQLLRDGIVGRGSDDLKAQVSSLKVRARPSSARRELFEAFVLQDVVLTRKRPLRGRPQSSSPNKA